MNGVEQQSCIQQCWMMFNLIKALHCLHSYVLGNRYVDIEEKSEKQKKKEKTFKFFDTLGSRAS